jgi:ketosteroid isomerase-like protein
MSNKAESKDYMSNRTVLITGALTGIDRAAALGGKKTSELERENMATDIGTPEDAKAIVKSFYEGGARGEITSFADRLADDFELFVPPSLPWGGQFNKAQYISILPQVASTLDFARMRYVSLTAEGQHVVALIDIGVQGTDKSVIISEHWDIENGKAIRLLVAYFDPRVLLDQIKSTSN